MVWEFTCPVDGCDYASDDNKQARVVEGAQQHMDDKHDRSATREDVEPYVIGPG